MDRGADVACVDLLKIGDAMTHHVQPLGVMHNLLWDQQLAIHQPAKLTENLLHALAQLRRMDEVGTHLLVIAEARSAVDQRIVMPGIEALRFTGNISLVEITEEYGG